MQNTLELVTIFRAETTIQADMFRGLLNSAADEVATCDLLREYLGENVKIGRIDSDIHTSTFSVLHYFIYPIYRFFRPLVIVFLIW